MKIENLKKLIQNNLENKTFEIKRVFHGRGNFYEDFNYLTVDSLNEILFATFFEESSDENEIIKALKDIANAYNYKTFIVQKKYKKDELNEAIIGEISPFYIVVENGLKYKINFFNKNIGIFLDMKIGREYINSICKDKNVLNLFSYTCAFSVVAINAKAKQVVNVDMAKGALTTGRENHHLNNLDTKKVKFMPYDILKSWNRIKKEGPYDIIIIDPPSFQKGSFAATKDYEKIIKKLPELASENCIVLSCLNAPELDSDFIKEKFKEFAPTFRFEKRLENLKEFITNNEEKSLKNLIFKKQNSN
ncbi:class I SAM-dependent methyltransferase [Aliarcobacter butzleri]|uniref:class I SAM-dependent methyltransferase n=1 Tax=Aliarcobacter butzleri TaxID=28197 RepID=UPI00126101A1|nr:class I SAM-dependent methyltransferase [Aliarcobacter butzleri]MCT7562903.1 class I SAM-dependent methyltransferase [Aliarcobacter butzleri]MCT7572000.1 class I SAM-dependent methyltransferase [Aliarcobacter butzleri]MCT7596983.1 class I SAM-dependent methyltransferase [Aliarcobacter butzleri]MCT7600777.1 class I SAM-dependent methyltransferase [Aliarcobacter butzleri]MCT7606033.1 class I SAM-dependent methyltransferase [Aliarcobacter butzleri]